MALEQTCALFYKKAKYKYKNTIFNLFETLRDVVHFFDVIDGKLFDNDDMSRLLWYAFSAYVL